MSNEIKETIFQLLRDMSIIIGVSTPKERLILYAERLVKFDLIKLKNAIEECASSCRAFPALDDIINKINPKMDKRNEAVELAGAIISCIRLFGRYLIIDVYYYVGREGQLAIERYGDWEMICNTHPDNMGTLRAQLRDICSSILEMKNLPIEMAKLPYQKQARTMLLGEGLKQLIEDFN
jgi:hypothetical protein